MLIGVGHDDDGAVAPGGGDHGQANAVLPEVGSMMTAPGLSSPFASASSSMALATRSLAEPAGVEILQLGQKGGVQALCRWIWRSSSRGVPR